MGIADDLARNGKLMEIAGGLFKRQLDDQNEERYNREEESYRKSIAGLQLKGVGDESEVMQNLQDRTLEFMTKAGKIGQQYRTRATDFGDARAKRMITFAEEARKAADEQRTREDTELDRRTKADINALGNDELFYKAKSLLAGYREDLLNPSSRVGQEWNNTLKQLMTKYPMAGEFMGTHLDPRLASFRPQATQASAAGFQFAEKISNKVSEAVETLVRNGSISPEDRAKAERFITAGGRGISAVDSRIQRIFANPSEAFKDGLKRVPVSASEGERFNSRTGAIAQREDKAQDDAELKAQSENQKQLNAAQKAQLENQKQLNAALAGLSKLSTTKKAGDAKPLVMELAMLQAQAGQSPEQIKAFIQSATKARLGDGALSRMVGSGKTDEQVIDEIVNTAKTAAQYQKMSKPVAAPTPAPAAVPAQSGGGGKVPAARFLP
jgi:hypothetical protein